MTNLHQLIAVEKSERNEALRRLTEAHRDSQKPDLLTGISRKYEPRNEEDFVYPGEVKRVQLTARDAVTSAQQALTRLFNITLMKDDANARARADVTVDGTVILHAAPVTYLLFLEKQLIEVRTFVARLPVLDPAEEWKFSDDHGHYVSREPARTAKTKKIPRAFTKAPATAQHPAQVDTFHEDVAEGTWSVTKFSGALPATVKAELLDRVTALQHAVKFAREEANGTEVTHLNAAGPVFGYLFGDLAA